MFCESCGREMKSGERFCPKCGCLMVQDSKNGYSKNNEEEGRGDISIDREPIIKSSWIRPISIAVILVIIVGCSYLFWGSSGIDKSNYLIGKWSLELEEVEGETILEFDKDGNYTLSAEGTMNGTYKHATQDGIYKQMEDELILYTDEGEERCDYIASRDTLVLEFWTETLIFNRK